MKAIPPTDSRDSQKTPPLSRNCHKTVTKGPGGDLSPGLSPAAASGGASRYGAPLKLTPAVVEILASLDPIPQGSATLRDSERSEERRQEARAEERRERARLLPHSGFSYG